MINRSTRLKRAAGVLEMLGGNVGRKICKTKR